MVSPAAKWRDTIRRTHPTHLAGGMLLLNLQETIMPLRKDERNRLRVTSLFRSCTGVLCSMNAIAFTQKK